MREAHEEIGVAISPQSLEYKAILTFIFPHKPECNQECHAFFTTKWVGEPQESEEMAPHWHAKNSLPFEHMWSDDAHWLPHALSGALIKARFHFDEAGALFEKIVSVVTAFESVSD